MLTKKYQQKLLKLKKKLKELSTEELKELSYLGKLTGELLGYPVATLSSGSGTGGANFLEEDMGKMLLTGKYEGPGEEFTDNAAHIGGMGLAAIMGFCDFCENLGSTGLAAMALGGFFGMTLLPHPGIFGDYIAMGIMSGNIRCPAYEGAKPLLRGDNFKPNNYFLSTGPSGTSPGAGLSALLSGYGGNLKKGEKSCCPGAFLGFSGKYGFY